MAKKTKKILTSLDMHAGAGDPLERRRFIRHPLCFPLTYRMLEKKDDGKGTRTSSINISMGGLLFLTKKAVAIGARIAINLPFQDKTFNVRAKVMRCEKSCETKLFNVGVSFYRLSDAFKVKLVEQLYLISEFRDLWSVQLGREVTLEEASREWIKRYSKRFKRLYW